MKGIPKGAKPAPAPYLQAPDASPGEAAQPGLSLTQQTLAAVT